jgi:hypothetical protein
MNRPFDLPVALPRGPEHYWKAACGFGAKGFTISDLAGTTCGVANSTVRQWVNAMARQGELTVVGARPGLAGKQAHLYAVAKAKVRAPVVRRPQYEGSAGRCQQYLWTAMRTLGTFGVEELAIFSSTDEVTIKPNTARKYIATLTRAGIVVVVEAPAFGKKGEIGATAGVWRLPVSKNSGPNAPKIFQASFVFDPNRGEIIGESEVSS